MFNLDIISIRNLLNEQAFEDGKRRICLGLASELFNDDASSQLALLATELQRHDLALVRGSEDPGELYVEQTLKHAAVDMSWMRDAVRWTSKITTVAIEMVLPGILGMWADQRFGTSYLMAAGILVGAPLGFWHLLRMTRAKRVE